MIVHGRFLCCFWGLERFFPIGVVGLSALGWKLVPRRSFRLSFTCLHCGVFWI